jgi:glyoxylase-like metal-dependent hydrolase (beta-lactamase superfamily II)
MGAQELLRVTQSGGENRIANQWFSACQHGKGVRLITEPYADDFIRGNFFIVDCGDETLMVDSGLGLASIRGQFPEVGERESVLVLTHPHNDHRGGAPAFEQRIAHRLDAPALDRRVHGRTRPEDWPTENIQAARSAGYQIPVYMLEREPHPGFDPDEYWIEPAPATRLVDEGDTVEVGSRRFSVLHLPGHTPGGIGLLEEKTGIFFSGDLLYDGPLVDGLPESNVQDFIRSVARIRQLPVSVMHGGHNQSVPRERMMELAEQYLSSKGVDPALEPRRRVESQ